MHLGTGSGLRARLAVRGRALASIRAFFEERGSLEVETPALLRAPAPERHIEAIPAAGGRFLAASPELQMKRLCAAGSGRIHQLARSFRGGELGRHHNPEFTLLEWYQPGEDYRAAMAETEALVRRVAGDLLGRLPPPGAPDDPYRTARRRPPVRLDAPFEHWRVPDAFARLAGWRPGADAADDRFFHDLVDKVEPGLPADRGLFLQDYPASQGSLARLSPADPALAERFELYLGGLETANGFTELADAAEQRRRFEDERTAIRAQGRTPYPLDERFLASVGDLGLCTGVALGVDRLLMALLGVDDLEAVVPFTWDEV